MDAKSSVQQPKLSPGLSVMGRLFSPVWWRHVWKYSWLFKPYLYLPAGIFLLSGLMLAPAMSVMMSFKDMGDEVHEAGPFLMQMGLVMLAMAAAGMTSIIGMGFGVFRLAVFTRAFLLFPVPTDAATIANEQYSERVRANQKEAFTVLKNKKGYLAQIWLLAALVMVPVIMVFCIASSYLALISLPHQDSITIPSDLQGVAFVATGLAFIILSNYSMITLGISSMTNKTIGPLLGRSFILLFTTAPLLTVVTLIVIVLNTAIGTPYAVPQLLHMTTLTTTQPIVVEILWEVWQVLTGIMLFPISTALLAEVLRECIDTEGQSNELPTQAVEMPVTDLEKAPEAITTETSDSSDAKNDANAETEKPDPS